MAEGRIFACTHCGAQHEAWDEGNPYIRDPLTRKKRYVFHPSPLRRLAEGVDTPHLCLDCGKTFMVDSERPRRGCPKCRSRAIQALWLIDGAPCPACRQGVFHSRDILIS